MDDVFFVLKKSAKMGCKKDAKPHLGCDGHHQDDMIFKALGSQAKP